MRDSGLVPWTALLFPVRTFTSVTNPCLHNFCHHGYLAGKDRILPTPLRLQILGDGVEAMFHLGVSRKPQRVVLH